jgi:hypothetical protein
MMHGGADQHGPEVAVTLYDAIVHLRPDRHDADLTGGAIKVVMTSPASDPPELRAHATNAAQWKPPLAVVSRSRDATRSRFGWPDLRRLVVGQSRR